MTIQPFGDNVIVEELPPETKSKGGIELPSNMATERQLSTVLHVGDAVTRVQPGDVVLMSSYAGFPFDGPEDDTGKKRKWIALKEEDIHAKVVQ